MNALTIGKLAKLSGIGIETIRFYERNGLLKEPPRRPSGYREYPEDAVRQVRFIRRAKELGFSLKEIGELLSLKVTPTTTCADIRERAYIKLKDIEEKVKTLQSMEEILKNVTTACEKKKPTTLSDCPILGALDALN